MADEQLSAALTAFIGLPGQLNEASPEARLVEVAGDSAVNLMPRITAVLDELDAESQAFLQASTLSELGRLVTEWLTIRYPELSRDSVELLANRFTFDHR